jgi:predicted oxidoreductase
LGKNEKTSANSRKNANNKKKIQNIGIKNFKVKMLSLMNKSLKLILIISALNA